VYNAWPIILVHMILYIDTIGLKPQRSKQKLPPILYIIAYPIHASSAIAVWLSSQTGSDLYTDEPCLVTRQRGGVNDELIHFPDTIDTSYRFVDLRSPKVNCRFHGTYSAQKPTV